jgi:ATP-dependent Clp protease ATP-binding subunit ClpA
LFGSPPGYVGYTDEGTFASHLRRQPFAVVLLDEFEKAHPEVQDAFLQIFSEGRFNDARGRRVDARQAVFILTSNLFTVGELSAPDEYDAHAEAVRQRLAGFFRPELINRIDDIVLFGLLSRAALSQIAARELGLLNERLAAYRISLRIGEGTLDWIAQRAGDPESGARAVLRLVGKEITEPVGAAILSGQIEAGGAIEVGVEGGELVLKVES